LLRNQVKYHAIELDSSHKFCFYVSHRNIYITMANNTATNLSAEALFRSGLEFAGFEQPANQTEHEKRRHMKRDMRRFKAHYGIGPEAIKALIADLESIQGKAVTPKCLFLTICWLRLYETEEVMAGRWGWGEKKCREIKNEYLESIHRLKTHKISFVGLNPNCKFLGVDCIHVPSTEFRVTPHSKWWSHKSNGPGVSFEIVCDPVVGKIRQVEICTGWLLIVLSPAYVYHFLFRWVAGPQPASVHDITILRGGKVKDGKEKWNRQALYWNVPQGVKLVGDSGYSGQQDKVTTTKDAHSKETKQLFARIKSQVETANGRFKNFKILTTGFRHYAGPAGIEDEQKTIAKLSKIKTAFEAVVVLVEYDIENGHPLFVV
jgi:hypothetical protein